MAKKSISASESASAAVGKINDNFTELYNKEGGDVTPSGVIALNDDAVSRIAAAKQHFQEGVGAASNYNKAVCFCIAHASDFHTDKARYERFRDFVDGVDMIDAAIVSGDLTDKGKSAEMSGMLAVEFDRITPMQVIGNHERQDGKTIAQVVSGMGMSAAYYYTDFSSGIGSQKIRIIVLNQYDTSSTSFDVAQATGHFSQTQIDWLLGVLDDAAQKGYHVIVSMHAPDQGALTAPLPSDNDKGFYQRDYRWKNNLSSPLKTPLVEDIIAAFKAKSTVSGTYTFTDGVSSVTVNHTFANKGVFVAYIVGHLHIDATGYSQQHGDQLYLVCPNSCVKGGENMLDPDGQERFYGGSVSDLPRIIGTKTEDCFNVYAIDTTNKVVKVVRVGADMNDLMEKREVAWFDYEPTLSND